MGPQRSRRMVVRGRARPTHPNAEGSVLSVLLESHRHHAKRQSAMALSVCAHVVIIAAAAAATASGTAARRNNVSVVAVHFESSKPPRAARHTSPTTATPHAGASPRLDVPPVGVPVNVAVMLPLPGSLPPLQLGALPYDSTGAAAVTSGISLGAAQTAELLADQDSDHQLRGAELLMRIVASARPRYPDALRQAGVSGRVVARFVVDSTGRIDMRSVQFIESAHPLFTSAVADVLPSFRFRPSRIGNRSVSTLGEMPFEFAIVR